MKILCPRSEKINNALIHCICVLHYNTYNVCSTNTDENFNVIPRKCANMCVYTYT